MREMMALALFCLLMVVVSLAAVVWLVVDAFLQHLPSEVFNMDSLLLISVCLLLATIFGFCFAWLARDLGLWERLRRRPALATNPEKKDTQQ